MCTVTTTIRIIFYHRFKTSTMNSTVSTMSNQIGIFFVDKKINKLSCSLLILSLSNVHTLSHCHSLRLPVDRYTFFSITYWEFPFINRSIQILIIFLFTLVISLVQKKMREWSVASSLHYSSQKYHKETAEFAYLKRNRSKSHSVKASIPRKIWKRIEFESVRKLEIITLRYRLHV